MHLHFLKWYPSEALLATTFHSMCEKTTRRKWRCFYNSSLEKQGTWLCLHSLHILFHLHELEHAWLMQILLPTCCRPGHHDFANEDVPVFLIYSSAIVVWTVQQNPRICHIIDTSLSKMAWSMNWTFSCMAMLWSGWTALSKPISHSTWNNSFLTRCWVASSNSGGASYHWRC